MRRQEGGNIDRDVRKSEKSVADRRGGRGERNVPAQGEDSHTRDSLGPRPPLSGYWMLQQETAQCRARAINPVLPIGNRAIAMGALSGRGQGGQNQGGASS
eukprot:14012273-Heterocapsa_arctica.AAC.1